MLNDRDDGSSTMMDRYLQSRELTDIFVSMDSGGQGDQGGDQDQDVDMRNGGETGEADTSQPTYDSTEEGDSHGDDNCQAEYGSYGNLGPEMGDQEDTRDDDSMGVQGSESSGALEQESQGDKDEHDKPEDDNDN